MCYKEANIHVIVVSGIPVTSNMADSLKLAGLFLVCFISVGLRDSAQGE